MTNKIRDLDIKLDIINKLLDCIEKYPEERIGQLIQNSISIPLNYVPDLFYVNDESLAYALKNRMKLE